VSSPATERLFSLTRPGSVALIGASPDSTRPATRVLRGLLRGPDRALFPVNPRYESVLGVPCVPELAALPGPPDLTVVAVRAEAVLDTVRAAADVGARSFLVFSSGFAETDSDGARRQVELRTLADERGLTMIGPNSLGLIDFGERFYCSFASILDGGHALPAGPVALVTQSGAIGSYVYLMAQARGLGLSHMISTGNEVALEASEVGTMLLDDPRVGAIALYTEGVRSGARMVELCERAGAAGVPVVVLRGGDSDRGRAAAQSHTGALAGSARVSDAVLARHGAVCVHTPEDLVTACAAATSGRPAMAPPSGLAVLSISGGGGVLVSDACARWGIPMATFSQRTIEALRPMLPAYGSPVNPVDLTATLLFAPDAPFARCMELIEADESVGELVVFLGAGGDVGPQVAERIVAGVRELRLRCSVIWLGVADDVAAILDRGGVPVFRGIEECIRPIALMARAGAPDRAPERIQVRSAEPRDISSVDPSDPVGAYLAGLAHAVLNEDESKHALGLAGFTDLPPRLVLAPGDPTAGVELGYPLVVKLLARDVPHKSKVGGVRVGIGDPAALAEAVEAVTEAGRIAVGADRVQGVLVEQMAPTGIEVIVGMATDPAYGRVLALGPGGVLAELIDDVTIVLPPATPEQVRSALGGSRLERLLGADHDLDALCALVARLSRLAADGLPGVRELDLNPVLVHREGLSIVDGLITKDPAEEPPDPPE